MKSTLLFLLLLCLAGAAVAQSPSPLRLSGVPSDTSLTSHVVWRATSLANYPPDTLALSTFQPLTQVPTTTRDSLYWLRLELWNDSPQAGRWVLYPPAGNDQVDVYIAYDSLGTWQHQRVGDMEPYWKVAYRYNNSLLPFSIPARTRAALLLKFRNNYQPAPNLQVRLLTQRGLEKDFWDSYSPGNLGIYTSVLILGAVFSIFLFVVFLYLKTTDRLYLYYALYLGGVVIYFSLKTGSVFWLGHYLSPSLRTLINEPIQLVYMGLYIRFSMGLLRIQEYDKPLWSFLNVFWKGLILYGVGVLVAVGLVWRREFDVRLFTVDRVVLLLFNLVMLARIIQKNRSPVLPYFLAGNIFFIAGVILATLGSLMVFKVQGISPINYFQIGVLAEIMCFSFALGFNVRLLAQERTENQKAYIQQLHLNQDITEQANAELQEKLSERTKEVMAMSEALQAQKEANLRSEFEFQLADMEMQALRAQMNPHFIFNSLNTIRYFVLNNENDKASDYLGKFSRLLRMVLQNSRENTISLSEELEALRLYLEIEARRFGDSFDYRLEVPEHMDTDALVVPPLLLQPFVENAIWHGLLHSTKPEKVLTIRLVEEEDACLFLIEDNGIGREKAREMKSKSASRNKSFGMQITHKRVELFNRNFSAQIHIQVADVVTPQGEVAGTRVEIRYQLAE
ncbi:hypothetical protein GCM10027275_27380 [Rhabdobacter roseus]|uniref:Signal transduction histidine kinase n=1 Tax=Rhabdobacter roseus TaxID=1655419 RepID=A0A840TP35_9BACT|nr:histidine kinase [Rhabdobacter roseus]MBB5284685.1 signal transduction histidine kinase [Rhabdobacter roseus]